MPSSQELNQIYTDLLGRAPDASGVQTFTPMSYLDTYNSVMNSPERQQYVQNTAQNQLKPTLDLSEQSINDQKSALQQQNDLGMQNLTNQESKVIQNYDTVGQNLINQAKTANNQFQSDQNKLGLLQGSGTSYGMGDIQTNLTKNQTLNEQDKANQLADLAIQRAGLTSTLNSGLKNLDLQGVQAQNTYGQSLNDLVSKLISGSRDTYNSLLTQEQQKQKDMMTIASTIPQRQSVNIAGYGTIQGTQAPVYKDLDLGNKIVSVDSQGNVVKSYAKGATPGSSGSGGGSNYYGTVPYTTAQKYSVKTATKSVPFQPTGNPYFDMQNAGKSQEVPTGLNFFDSNSAPISAGQYARDTGTPLVQLLANSPDAGDQNIVNDINNHANDKDGGEAFLRQKYPWIFRGV